MTTYIAADHMITSLGFSSRENIDAISSGRTGIRQHKASADLDMDCCISKVDSERLDRLFGDFGFINNYTRMEKLAISSIRYALEQVDIDFSNPKTLMVLSTTKGNIDLLGKSDSRFNSERVALWKAAQIIAAFFGNPNTPVVVSNACVTGVIALITAARLLDMGAYKNVVVVGVDIASKFVVSGFQALKASSTRPCKPYDKDRDGLSLGEGAATIILTSNPELCPSDRIVLRAGVTANDANHISGPSRSGDGVYQVIRKILEQTGESGKSIDYISAHGTATQYNDDMESVALNRAKLESAPVNSFKGYFGHTLGAAGILETAAALHSMRENTLFATKGFSRKGTVEPINVIRSKKSKTIDHCLKIASGFGGCNAGILLSKEGSF